MIDNVGAIADNETATIKDDQCNCNDNHKSYKIIENYRSILNRKQSLISTWKIFEQNDKISFTQGTKFRKHTDALVIRLNHTCLIHPWYKYININKHLLSILKQNQSKKVFEIILLECNCVSNSYEYELAIIECPCVEKTGNYCTYCRLTLEATEKSNHLLKDISEQTEISFPLNAYHQDININDSFYGQSGPFQYQRTVEIQVESDQVHHAISQYERNLLTTKKLIHEDVNDCLSETQSITLLQNDDNKIYSSQSNISTSSLRCLSSRSISTTSSYRTRGTQTKLFALLLPQSPLSEMKSAEIAARTLKDITQICQVNTLSYLIKMNESETEIQHSNEDIEDVQQIDHSLILPFPDDNTRLINDYDTPSSLKCINTCDEIDLDEPITSRNSNIDTLACLNINNDHDHTLSNNYSSSKIFQLKLNHHYRIISRKRRQYRNKKQIFSFLQRLYRRNKSQTCHLHQSSIDHSNPIKQDTSSNQSTIDLQLNTSDNSIQYKSHDYIVVARASKSSSACKQFQQLLNNSDTNLDELIDFQVRLTCKENYRSICILIDDQKQSKKSRSSFLHYIYTTLSNTLKEISHNHSIQLKCMNLVFFHNSLCDISNMQKLRLIDTGKQILLQPSCEISINSSDDIDIVMNRLSTKMLFAHQIFIINIYDNQSSLSSSYLFLQLAPICSLRPTGLLTNLNSTTYSVMNLIRQLNSGQLFQQNKIKQYLLNDCLLNRLLKSYLFSLQQSIIVIKSK